MLLLNLIILFILFLIQAVFVLLVAGPLILLKPTRRTKEWYARYTTHFEPRDVQLPQEEITIETFDGYKLHGWLMVHPSPALGTVIYQHGVGDCKIGGVDFARYMFDQGFHVILYDSRAHGESEGLYCTYGFYEKYDLRALLTYMQSRIHQDFGKFGIFGTSMGAAIALQTAAIDHRLSAVVSEGSFTNLRTIFVDYQKRIIKLPWHFLRNVALVHSQRIANFKARLVSPLEDVRKIRVPILFVHGENDSFIKKKYAHALFEAARDPKELLIVPGANHSNVWDVGGSAYHEALAEFFKKHLTQ